MQAAITIRRTILTAYRNLWGQILGGTALEPPKDEVLTAFAEAGGAGIIIARGAPGARFMMKLTPMRLYVLADGEPRSKSLIDVLAEAVATGKLKSSSTLVDLTRFTGSVDWEAVKTMRDMSPRGIEDASSVAYVVRNKLFVKLTKILGVMFPKIRHEAFTSRAEAVAWLDSFDKA